MRFSIAVDSSLVYMACSLTKQKKRYLLYWKQNAAIFLFGLLPHVISFIGIDPYLSSSFFGAPFIPKPAILDTPFIGARLRPLSCKGLSFALANFHVFLRSLHRISSHWIFGSENATVTITARLSATSGTPLTRTEACASAGTTARDERVREHARVQCVRDQRQQEAQHRQYAQLKRLGPAPRSGVTRRQRLGRPFILFSLQ